MNCTARSCGFRVDRFGRLAASPGTPEPLSHLGDKGLITERTFRIRAGSKLDDGIVLHRVLRLRVRNFAIERFAPIASSGLAPPFHVE